MRIRTKLSIEQDGVKLGAGRVRLLRLIDEHGSISAAARALGMSYKKAWDSIEQMNSFAVKPLVVRQSGGSGGGGTKLTDFAKELLQLYEETEQRLQKFISGTSETSSLNLSSRNKIKVHIKKIKVKVEEVVVHGMLGEQKLKAIITHQALQELNLKEKDEVLFIFKAGAVSPKGGNTLEGRLVEKMGEQEIKVEVEGEVLHIRGKFKLKGFMIHFSIDPRQIIIAKETK
ncbi:LysR family transcriptional regulator [Nitratiruptor sp. YY09-18]|uniref:LysR family transcriptional regulator n=1 Tax=Nitratiruptor sp. YY09-18 TaxID=2724901 RepID=UPI0019165387|nr:LysR family transcriptional regulator [Nitratiruptor sp. YY09-18]BCD67297.1 molybdate transport system regulatory protein [Nitratiruptor sp. YY09-18]